MTKELKIETRRGTLLDGVLFGTGDKADAVKSSGIAASRGSDTVLICIQLRENFGHSETLYACNIYQFTDYSRYAMTVFKEEDKRKYRDEHFPQDLQNAFELGKRLVNNCQKQE